MENNEGRKVIKISFNKFLAIAASVAIVGALGTILCVNKPWENKSKPEIQAEQKNEPEVTEIILDKVWIKDNLKIKYPSNWELTENETYAAPTVLTAPGNNDDEKAKLYITINENTGNRTAKEIIEVATNPDYGVSTETVDEGEKDIAGIKAYYKTQSMSYDDGSNWKSTTAIFIKDICVYELMFSGSEDEYNSYYQVFEKILEQVKFTEYSTGEKYAFCVPVYIKKEVGHYYDDTGISFFEDNTFSIKIEEGFSILGNYRKTDNEFICTANKLEGEFDNGKTINSVIKFEVNPPNIELVSIEGEIGIETEVLKIGNIYTK